MPVREIVASYLRPMHETSALADTEFTLAVQQAAGTIGAEAVAGCGWGLDHFGGEHVLASALHRWTPRSYEHRLSLAITDRRTIVSGWSSIKGGFNDIRFSIPHELIQGVEVKDGLLENCVKLHANGRVHELTFPDGIKILGAFYSALANVPPNARVSPPFPLPAQTADDPSGARAAAGGLWRQDPLAGQALAHIEHLVASGQIDAGSGYDFVCRLLLAHRSSIGGPGGGVPGQTGQVWLSPMSATDLGHTLVGIYGRPVQYQVAADGWAWHEFRIDPNRDYLGGVLTALGVAAFVGIGFGFSPGRVIADRLMRRDPITGLRIGVLEGSACSMYLVDGPRGRLENSDANMLHRLHQALIHSSYRVLERRASLGWQVDYSRLF